MLASAVEGFFWEIYFTTFYDIQLFFLEEFDLNARLVHCFGQKCHISVT